MASTSDRPDRAFVWAWLPGRTDPVFVGDDAGKLDQRHAYDVQAAVLGTRCRVS